MTTAAHGWFERAEDLAHDLAIQLSRHVAPLPSMVDRGRCLSTVQEQQNGATRTMQRNRAAITTAANLDQVSSNVACSGVFHSIPERYSFPPRCNHSSLQRIARRIACSNYRAIVRAAFSQGSFIPAETGGHAAILDVGSREFDIPPKASYVSVNRQFPAGSRQAFPLRWQCSCPERRSQ